MINFLPNIAFILLNFTPVSLTIPCWKCYCFKSNAWTVMDCSILKLSKVPKLARSAEIVIMKNNNLSSCSELCQLQNSSIKLLDISHNPFFPCSCLYTSFQVIDSCPPQNSRKPSTSDHTSTKHSSLELSSHEKSSTLHFTQNYSLPTPSQHSLFKKNIASIIGSCFGTLIMFILLVLAHKIKKKEN